jgi:DNA-binding IclR family transcriptional regulator
MPEILTPPVSPTTSRCRLPSVLRYPDRPAHLETRVTTARDRPPEEAAEDTSFARGLRVFLTIADRGEVRADELSSLLDTPLSTIYRYLRTLTEFGFVDRQEGGYRLGPRLHVLGVGPAVSAEELIRAADPLLAELTAATGETSFISRRVGLGAVCLAQQTSSQPLRVSVEPGTTAPLDVGAAAKVLLAYAPEEIRDAALAEAVGAAALRREMGAIASAGWAQDDGASFAGAVTIAVPVLRDDGIIAAIALTAPSDRATRRWVSRARGGLEDAALAIEASLRSDGTS